jgi:tetratricopeptide (TPR) repeat protein
MSQRRLLSPHFTSLLQLAATLLIVVYLLLIGGSFNATVNYRVQLLNALGAGGLGLGWLAWHLRSRSPITPIGLELPLVLFVLSQWIATFTSAQFRLSLEQTSTTTVWAISFIIFCDLLAQGWPQRFIENALILAALLITLQALFEIAIWLSSWLQLGLLPPVVYRVTGFLGHPNLTAASLNLSLPFIIVRIVRAASRPSRIGFSLLLIGLLIVEFFTSSRSGWIGATVLVLTLAGLSVFGVSAQDRLRGLIQKFNGLARGLRLALLIVSLILISFAGYVLWLQTLHPSHPEFFSSRQYIWGPAWENFLAQPLTGGGPGLYTWFYPKYTSVPPEWLAPHAHSLLFQTLGESGLIGVLTGTALLSVAAYQLWQRWLTAVDKLWGAASLAAGAGWLTHHIFDYLFNTPAFLFLFIVVAALAFRSTASPKAYAKPYSPLYLALPIAGLIGFAIFSLRAAALNDQGLQAVADNRWSQAAAAFEQAARMDPGLTLYWQNAAYAYTRADDLQASLPLWQQVAQDDPHWAIPIASLAVLQSDPMAMQTALALAPHSDLLALNTGVLFESQGDSSAAQRNYELALNSNPDSAQTLFWQQTPLRQQTLQTWQRSQTRPVTFAQQGWQALADHQSESARQYFESALSESPTAPAYIGLARAYWALGDETQAQQSLAIAKLIPTTALSESLQVYLFEGDWADAHHNRTAAVDSYKTVFSIVNDFTYGGPGTYGYPQRYWYVYHRPAPPSDLVPQLARATITAELDERFLKLGEWLAEAGQPATACYVWGRVYSEAENSESGHQWLEACR